MSKGRLEHIADRVIANLYTQKGMKATIQEMTQESGSEVDVALGLNHDLLLEFMRSIDARTDDYALCKISPLFALSELAITIHNVLLVAMKEVMEATRTGAQGGYTDAQRGDLRCVMGFMAMSVLNAEKNEMLVSMLAMSLLVDPNNKKGD
jgi:hypothetical protein